MKFSMFTNNIIQRISYSPIFVLAYTVVHLFFILFLFLRFEIFNYFF
jgi:hypothetical protein